MSNLKEKTLGAYLDCYKRITRDRRLTPEEAAHYNKIREQVEAEFPPVQTIVLTIDCRKENVADVESALKDALRKMNDGSYRGWGWFPPIISYTIQS